MSFRSVAVLIGGSSFSPRRSSGFALGIDPGQTYEQVTVPIGPGEVVIFRSDYVTAGIHDQGCNIDLEGLRTGNRSSPWRCGIGGGVDP